MPSDRFCVTLLEELPANCNALTVRYCSMAALHTAAVAPISMAHDVHIQVSVDLVHRKLYSPVLYEQEINLTLAFPLASPVLPPLYHTNSHSGSHHHSLYQMFFLYPFFSRWIFRQLHFLATVNCMAVKMDVQEFLWICNIVVYLVYYQFSEEPFKLTATVDFQIYILKSS